MAKKEFERLCFLYSLEKEDYEREFSSKGRQFKLTGLSIKSPKYPCLALDISNGKTYKLRAEDVREALGNSRD